MNHTGYRGVDDQLQAEAETEADGDADADEVDEVNEVNCLKESSRLESKKVGLLAMMRDEGTEGTKHLSLKHSSHAGGGPTLSIASYIPTYLTLHVPYRAYSVHTLK